VHACSAVNSTFVCNNRALAGNYGAMANELDELYEARPEEFTARRTELAAAAKKQGDADTAKQISAARKPTTAAWVVNRIALRDSDVRTRLAGLGERLRDAHTDMDGNRDEKRDAARRDRDKARAALAAAERAKADTDAALTELQSDLATARMRRDDARRRLQNAEDALAAAEDAYDKGKQASRDAAA